jgi:hypothetical protein
MDQIAKTKVHEFVDLEVTGLLLRVYAFCEEGHAIMVVLLCLFTSEHASLDMWN